MRVLVVVLKEPNTLHVSVKVYKDMDALEQDTELHQYQIIEIFSRPIKESQSQ